MVESERYELIMEGFAGSHRWGVLDRWTGHWALRHLMLTDAREATSELNQGLTQDGA